MIIQNATMVSLVQTALKSATQLVETATKRVVYVTRDANRDGKDFIVKMVFFVIVVYIHQTVNLTGRIFRIVIIL